MDYKNDPSLFIIEDGVKIYTGTTEYLETYLNKSVKYYMDLVNKTPELIPFTKLNPSTLTAKGEFSNIEFNEEEIIEYLSEPTNPNILKLGCNFGELYNSTTPYSSIPLKERKSNRGRKPKSKSKSKRKIQGSGRYFNTQITFEIVNPSEEIKLQAEALLSFEKVENIKKIEQNFELPEIEIDPLNQEDLNLKVPIQTPKKIEVKPYKIKLFRNGPFQVPGISHIMMFDLIKPAKDLRNYLREEFGNEEIEILNFKSVMRNYKCSLAIPTSFIFLKKLEEVLIKEKQSANRIHDIKNFLANFDLDSDTINEVCSYVGGSNPMNIAEIQNNCERYFGIKIKFYRPVPWKLDKKTTIKILRSGKINFDGGNSEIEIKELYYWLQWIIIKNYNEVIYTNETPNVGSESDTEYSSLYDSD